MFYNTVVVGSSSYQYAYVYNIGSANATVSSVVVSGTNAGDFSIDSNYCGTVGYSVDGYSCSVHVKFTPKAAAGRTANLVFTDSTPGSPHTVTLTGVGQ